MSGRQRTASLCIYRIGGDKPELFVGSADIGADGKSVIYVPRMIEGQIAAMSLD